MNDETAKAVPGHLQAAYAFWQRADHSDTRGNILKTPLEKMAADVQASIGTPGSMSPNETLPEPADLQAQIVGLEAELKKLGLQYAADIKVIEDNFILLHNRLKVLEGKTS